MDNKTLGMILALGGGGASINDLMPSTKNTFSSDKILSLIDTKIYGFHIDSSESDPEKCVTYLADAMGKIPCYMDYANNKFVWGSWKNAFFMPRPCMVKYNGKVDYYLDPNDYSKKEDGTSSDVSDFSYGGNAMMEWGKDGQKIWYKIVPDAEDDTSASVYISNEQVDSDYKAWSFFNADGEMVDHFYTPIYTGSIDENGRLRSISGKTKDYMFISHTVSEEVAAAELNNLDDEKIWYTEQFSDFVLIDFLLILISKSLDLQTVFGNGRINLPNESSNILGTGTMDDKGMFWGSNENIYGVKAFGMENLWSNIWRRFAGLIGVDDKQYYKMTRSTSDGSTASDFNQTGEGYILGGGMPSSSGWLSKVSFNNDGWFVNSIDGGGEGKYWCDRVYVSTTGTHYAVRGGHFRVGAVNGRFIDFSYASTKAINVISGNLTCR